MTSIRNTARFAAALLLAAGISTSVSAEEWTGPRVVGSGENASVVYDTPNTNVVGGALTRVIGSGESATTEVIATTNVRPGRLSRVVGSGEGAQTVPLAEAPRG